MVFFVDIQILQANSGDPDQTLHSAVSGLGQHYMPTSHKKVSRHIWVEWPLKKQKLAFNTV